MSEQPGPVDAEGPTSSSEPPGADGPAGQVEVPLRRLSPLTPIARMFVLFAAVVFTGWRQFAEDQEISLIALGLGLVLAAGLVAGFATWWRTRFRITASELRIDTGVFSRQSRRVRLDRIVAIDVNQPFAARVLGLSELKIETATTESEVKLSYLSNADAAQIREVLLEHRQPIAADGSATPVPEPVALVQVPLRWHLISILASGETIALVIFGTSILALFAAGVPFAAMGVGLASVGGVALAFLRKLVGRWNWRVSAIPTGVQVRRGLLNVTTMTFDVRRLQGVKVVRPLLWRPWDLASLELSVAGGVGKPSQEGEDSHGLALPAAPLPLVRRLAADLLGADSFEVALQGPGPRAGWLAPMSRRWLGFGLDDRLAVARWGWLGRTRAAVPLARAQSVRLAHGPLQRSLGLATVRLDTPDGSTSLVGEHLATPDARRLLDLLVAGAHTARLPTPTVLTPAPPAPPADQSEPPHERPADSAKRE